MTNLSGANLNSGAAVGPQGEGMDSPSTFPAYSAYKDSGVEWAGALPVEWQILKLKRAARLQSGEFITSEAIEEDAQYPVYGGNGLRGYTVAYTHNGEFALIGRQGALCGNINYAEGKFWASEHAVVVYPEKGIVTRWLGELLRSMNLGQYSVSAAQPGLSVERIADLFIPVPSSIEQTQIARFLDHEIARIDALIEEQQRLIELLKEKRQAVISHAVTKGLDPNVPLQDSGVEWLGEVPCSWRVIKFGITHDKAELGGNYEAGESEEGLPLIKMGNIGRGKIKLDKVEYVSLTQDIDNGHTLKEGDFLFNTRNSLDLVGKVCVWRRELQAALYNSNILRISFNKSLIGSSGFVNYLLNSNLGLEQLRLIARGTTSVAAIYYKDLSSLSFAFPLPSEQLEIERFLDIQTTQLDALVNAAEQAIDLIKERRSALISAAVTGKIDVRSWQPPASAQAPESVQEAV
ncbi:restriction endonuclease subunit S [Pseudomonas sp.]|uniref:restriction endonuclease subunit S n=1 Tax=Pseudomonas sp. TaxID=306 RepID=UPI003BB679EC